MRSDPDFRSFLRKWRDAFRAPSDLWDGNRAVKELRTAPSTVKQGLFMLGFVRCDSEFGWRPLEMLGNVLDEVEDYQRQALVWHREFKKTELLIGKMERQALRQSQDTTNPELKQLLDEIAKLMAQGLRHMKEISDPTLRSPLGPWEGLWPKHARKNVVDQAIGLDARLQIQTAKMFRTFLHEDAGISLRTIARLVILVYYVTGLAREGMNDDRLWIPTCRRWLTVRNVEDKLRRKGIR